MGEFIECGVGVLAGGQQADGDRFAEFFAKVWILGDSGEGFGQMRNLGGQGWRLKRAGKDAKNSGGEAIVGLGWPLRRSGWGLFGFGPDGGEGVDHGDEIFGIATRIAALNLVEVFARASHEGFLDQRLKDCAKSSAETSAVRFSNLELAMSCLSLASKAAASKGMETAWLRRPE